jgi:hypothetical protein
MRMLQYARVRSCDTVTGGRTRLPPIDPSGSPASVTVRSSATAALPCVGTFHTRCRSHPPSVSA